MMSQIDLDRMLKAKVDGISSIKSYYTKRLNAACKRKASLDHSLPSADLDLLTLEVTLLRDFMEYLNSL